MGGLGGAQPAISLYRSLLRAAARLPTANRQLLATDRIRLEFRKAACVRDEDALQELFLIGHTHLESLGVLPQGPDLRSTLCMCTCVRMARPDTTHPSCASGSTQAPVQRLCASPAMLRLTYTGHCMANCRGQRPKLPTWTSCLEWTCGQSRASATASPLTSLQRTQSRLTTDKPARAMSGGLDPSSSSPCEVALG